MYPSQSPDGPARQAGYIPYFYQSGLYLRYPVGFGSAPESSSRHSSSTYAFTSDRPPGRDFDRVQTVEQVIAQGYFATPYSDPVTAIISDKRHTARFGLDDVIQQIRSRHDLYSHNMGELDQAVCEATNAVFRQEADQGQPANDRQWYSANKMIQGIYEQKRLERLNLWRDVSRLRLGLPEAAQQYLTAYRKVSALESSRGDGS